MTAPADDPPVPPETGDGSPLERILALGLDLPDAPTGARRARLAEGDGPAGQDGPAERDVPVEPVEPAPGPARPVGMGRWRAVRFGLAFAVLVVAGVALAVTGVHTVRTSTAGQRVDPTVDPASPGFEAFVEPSPTTLVVHRDAAGLTSITLLALRAGDAGGSVLVLAPNAVVDPGGDRRTLADVLGSDGIDALRDEAAAMLGIGIEEVVELDDDGWTRLVAPVAPLVVENPDDLGEFPLGTLQLGGAQVGPYLRAGSDVAEEPARLVRHRLLWEAWIDAVAASELDDPVPGERDAGFGRFVRGLAAGPLQVAALPAASVDAQGFVVDAVAAAEVVGALVPFPVAAEPGGRIRVRLLSGTGDPDLALAAAPLVIPAGGQIVLAGNALATDHTTTEVRYHDGSQQASAERLVAALGTGVALFEASLTDTVDVTIVLGSDLGDPADLLARPSVP